MTTIRRPGAASAAVLVGLTTSLLAAHAVAPDWSRRAGLDVWSLPALERERLTVAEERNEVEAKAERAARRRETANQIAAQLIAHEIALPTAADQIHKIFDEDPGTTITLGQTYPAPTERLRFARHTIERATRLLNAEPAARREAVLARLEAEYREMATAHESPTAP